MQFEEDRATAEFVIHSCGAEGILVNDRLLTESFMLLPGSHLKPWQIPANTPLTAEHFAAALQREPELVILGTGAKLRLPDPEVYGNLLAREIGLEAMTTAAACRTYNLLAQDGREIAACMILPA